SGGATACAGSNRVHRAVGIALRPDAAVPQIPEETELDDVGLIAGWSRDTESAHPCCEMLRFDEAAGADRAIGYSCVARVREMRTQRTRHHAARTTRAGQRATALDASLSWFTKDRLAIHHHTQSIYQPDYQADWSSNPISPFSRTICAADYVICFVAGT